MHVIKYHGIGCRDLVLLLLPQRLAAVVDDPGVCPRDSEYGKRLV